MDEGDIRVSLHAVEKYQIRSGRKDYFSAYEALKWRVNRGISDWYTNPREVRDLGFSITQYSDGDIYGVWEDDNVPEQFCVIVASNSTAITVLSKTIYDMPVRPNRPPKKIRKVRGGTHGRRS